MKKQVLYINSEKGKQLKFKNSNLILVDSDGKIVLQHSCHRIFAVFVFGEATITSVLIKNAKKYGISIIFLSYNFKPYFVIAPELNGNFLLREKQYKFEDNLALSIFVVRNKILNQRFLLNSLRYKSRKDKHAIKKLDAILDNLDLVKNNNDLLGLEGNASKVFFKNYFKNINFTGRKPRVKSDILNLLLDIGYTILFNFIEANLVLYGFDVYCGFYHKFFFQRKSLVCDIIEPFRCIIEKRIRKSYNLNQINERDFGFRNGQYFVKIKYNKKYSRIFLKEILLYKEGIFLFIQRFYRNFMKKINIGDYSMFLLGDLK